MARIPLAQNTLSSSARPAQSCSYNANARRAAICFELPYPSAPNTLRNAPIAVGDCFSLRVSHDGSCVGPFSCWYGLTDQVWVQAWVRMHIVGGCTHAVELGWDAKDVKRCVASNRKCNILDARPAAHTAGRSG